MMQVGIELDLEQGIMMLPARLSGLETRPGLIDGELADDIDVGECVILTIPGLQLHFRMHDYYMGLLIWCCLT